MKAVTTPLVFLIKFLSAIFYRTRVNWITAKDDMKWDHIRLVVVLNHTSLFEPLFISAIPNRNLWRAVHRLVVPVAGPNFRRAVIDDLEARMRYHCRVKDSQHFGGEVVAH